MRVRRIPDHEDPRVLDGGGQIIRVGPIYRVGLYMLEQGLEWRFRWFEESCVIKQEVPILDKAVATWMRGKRYIESSANKKFCEESGD